jgi:hypothetical protein
MGYIDAGYAVALVTLVAYGAYLWLRRVRLERLVARDHTARDHTARDHMAAGR